MSVEVLPNQTPIMESYREPSFEEIIPMPYASRLITPIEAGQTVVVQGKVNTGATRFEVNLLNGVSSPQQLQYHAIPKQVPLHICFHFEVGICVLNSYLDGDWGYEECHMNPLFPGSSFEVAIRVHNDKYEILVDNKHVAFYNHRISYKTVDYIQIRGDIILSCVRWAGRYFELPFETAFHGHALENGQRVHVYGIPGNDFTVDLLGQRKDVLFRLNPQFAEKQIVRNACLKEEWGEAEIDGEEFPFKRGEKFDLVILNDNIALEVFINSHLFCKFFHRTSDPHKDYKHVRIDGSIELMGVEVSLCWETVGGMRECCTFAEKSHALPTMMDKDTEVAANAELPAI